MAWPKGKPRPDAFKRKDDPEKLSPEEMAKSLGPEQVGSLMVSLPITEKLADVIGEIEAVLISYRHDIEIKVERKSNITTGITVTIMFDVK